MENSNSEKTYPAALDELNLLDPDSDDSVEAIAADYNFIVWKVRRALLDAAEEKDIIALGKLLKELRGF